MEHIIWLWIAIFAIAIIVELLTKKLISVWFAPGAVLSAVLNYCDIKLVYQVIACISVALLGMILSYLIITRKSSDDVIIDDIIGESCVVSERIDNYAGCGQVKVKGQFWSARGVSDDDVYEVGQKLSVVAIEGVKLICKKRD